MQLSDRDSPDRPGNGLLIKRSVGGAGSHVNGSKRRHVAQVNFVHAGRDNDYLGLRVPTFGPALSPRRRVSRRIGSSVKRACRADQRTAGNHAYHITVETQVNSIEARLSAGPHYAISERSGIGF